MKDEILQTALSQFLKFGIREMSIKRLIEPLGISTKTVYKYYKNKEELLEEVLHLHYAQQYKIFESRTVDQSTISLLFDIWYIAVERDFNVNDLFYWDLHYYYPELEKTIEAAVGAKFGQQFQILLQKGMSDGVLNAGMLPEVAMEGIYILYNAIARTELFKKFGTSPYDVFLNTIVPYIRGICTPQGVQELEEYMANIKPFGENDDSGKIALSI
jgi:AcrR family transcriptional regulator